MATRGPRIRPTARTASEFEQELVDNLYYQRGTTFGSASPHDLYQTLAVTIRDHLVHRWARTTKAHFEANPKFVYYLSAEYLLGSQLRQNMLYTGTEELVHQAVADLGGSLEDLAAVEALDVEPGLGGGGLGRLAACLLDSMATLDIPAVGYGLRYEFGIFRQGFQDGSQVEYPDEWLSYGSPWEFEAPDDRHVVGFYGHTERIHDEEGRTRVRWVPGETVLGEPSHMLVPGYGTGTVNILRLWRARAAHELELAQFDTGHYAEAVEAKVRSENITKVLYPNDSTTAGQELRLKQQYFLATCSLRDIVRRFHFRNSDWDDLPEKVVIQLNDTHPVLAVPELMRLLVDEHGVGWDRAWSIARRTFAYTCHTLMPEALERWPIRMFERCLPRHMEIVYDLNRDFLDEVRARHPGDGERAARLSLIEEGPDQRVRMANLAVLGSFAVNGVAELHSRLLAEGTFRDFAEMWPERFTNETNGVSPRRFVRLANPRLAALITARLGDERWLTDLERLRDLEPLVDDPSFRDEWAEVKRLNKLDLAAYARTVTGVAVDPESAFDVMVKRMHEYKRQLLKVLHVVALYQRYKADPGRADVPRTFVFGAKAAPAYAMAKRIIVLINSVAAVVNADADLGSRLRVVFLPNYDVSVAERIIPAADVSEQISLAGTEASGTGNMKLALNGAVTVGTLDGANIEIREQVGAESFFSFGMTVEEVSALRLSGYSPAEYVDGDPELRSAIGSIAAGAFSDGHGDVFAPIVESLLERDPFLVLADFRSYVDCQDRVGAAWLDRERWLRMSILNCVRCGSFSSDRTVRGYCRDVWHVGPVRVSPEV